MSAAGIVAILLGILIILSRGPLLLFPAHALRWFAAIIKSKSSTRLLGAIVVLIALLMIWSGMSGITVLEGVLFIAGLFILLFAAPTLLVVPKIYMDLANSFLPEELSGPLFGWRLMGLLGVVIGVAIVMVGIDAL